MSQSQSLAVLPTNHLPVVAKLVHERCAPASLFLPCRTAYACRRHFISDKTIAALARYVHKQLVPADEDVGYDNLKSTSASTVLALDIVEAAIKSVATRVNYGLESLPGGSKIPAGLMVWRWEVNEDKRDFLPSSVKEKAEARLAERVQVRSTPSELFVRLIDFSFQAKKDLATLFDAFPQETKDELLSAKGASKQPLKDKTKANAPTGIMPSSAAEGTDSPSTTKGQKCETEEAENVDGDVGLAKLHKEHKLSCIDVFRRPNLRPQRSEGDPRTQKRLRR